MSARLPSDRSNVSWIAGIRVTNDAKANPWQKNAVLTATRWMFTGGAA